MKRHLETVQLLSREPEGWASPELRFGDRTTLVSGPLGSGKTPVMKAIAYALGAAVELPPAVRERCGSVRLTIRVGEDVYKLERLITTGVVVRASSRDGQELAIADERQLSSWVLDKLGIPERDFVSIQGAKTFSYVSVLAPVFLVDQDIGWSAPYVALESVRFVRDQREEVLRWVLGVPVKHRAVDKSAYQDAKTEQEAIQQQIAFKRRTIEKLIREDERFRDPLPLDVLVERRTTLHEQLRAASSVMESMVRSESALDARIRELGLRRDTVRMQLEVLERRRAQIASVHGEVQAETEALEQNEIAAAAFRMLCSSENCKFFRQPDESYGRRLLYLKDQLKDFSVSASRMADEIAHVAAEVRSAEATVGAIIQEKKRALGDSGAAQTIAAVESLSKEISEISVMIDRLERLTVERRQLEALINQEARAGEKVVALRPTGTRRENSRLLDARAHLAKAFNEWVQALRTPNVSLDAVVDEELRIVIGGERFDAKVSHSGSTRTRLVLAFHGALVEASLRMGGNHPPVLALDAPRQHELSSEDIRQFVERFDAIAGGQVQLVLSATDEDVVQRGNGVAIWTPSYPAGGDERRYLGAAGPAV